MLNFRIYHVWFQGEISNLTSDNMAGLRSQGIYANDNKDPVP